MVPKDMVPLAMVPKNMVPLAMVPKDMVPLAMVPKDMVPPSHGHIIIIFIRHNFIKVTRFLSK